LCEALGQVGKVEEGITLINSSLAVVNSTSERLAYSDICRLKGELLLAGQLETQSPDVKIEAAIETARRISTEAEDYFRQAIAYAQEQQAKSVELRAVISLSRLFQNQGRKVEALQMLSAICARFTEGDDTIDLRNARVLLAELS